MKPDKGFTIIELLIAMAIMAILATSIVYLINPARQLAKARDTVREADLYAVLSVVYQYQAEHSGAIPDTDGDPETSNFPTTETCIGTGGGCFDLGSAGDAGEEIVPVYMAVLPQDPTTGDVSDTGYSIYVDANNRIVVTATGETQATISITR
jgi:prepilin-type N-terminal cleavage/methylation domain-containing protein